MVIAIASSPFDLDFSPQVDDGVGREMQDRGGAEAPPLSSLRRPCVWLLPPGRRYWDLRQLAHANSVLLPALTMPLTIHDRSVLAWSGVEKMIELGSS